MKKRISATIDSETEKMLDSIMENENYRNKSHAIEEIIKLYFEEKNEYKK